MGQKETWLVSDKDPSLSTACKLQPIILLNLYYWTQPVLKDLYRYLLCFALLLVINLILFALDRGFSFETQPSSITVKFRFN
ncbi:hypothetical protein F0562_011829 [Nyssa sinensis]|uniref:Uncharacterized protein n=1 Tax=Nyssa sinensis TaxID=561372 RepID=A0A5J4ZTM1_9ASTE|nr:hypothetical protein F0562_011829 [Nyssa sinensis]